MKKAISLVLTLVIILSAVNLSAFVSFAETSTDGKYDYYVSGNNATILKYNIQSDAGSFAVPAKIGSYNVTAIEDFCFSQCSLTSVSVPNSVITVGDCAFEKCSKLTTVTFGAGMKNFGTNVFSETPRLSAINVSASNPYFTSVSGVLYSKDKTVIYSYPVAKTDDSFVVPNTVKSIEHYAFDGANNLKTLTVGTGMTAISDLAFIGASNIESVNILGEVTYIGNNAFGNINKLTSINIPDTVTYIGKEAFQDDNSLKSLLIPSSVNYIGVDAFEATAPDFLVYCYTGSFAVTYCETYNIEYELVDSVLSSIAITSAPVKSEYCLGTELDTSGLIVSAVYSNGISRTVTGYKLSAFDSSSVGAKAVTVSFTDGGITRSAAFSVSVNDHKWEFSSYVSGSEPTCTEKGLALYTCSVCGGEKTEEVDALGHKPVDDIWEEPTCTESGMKDIVCERCGELIETDIIVPALGHISDNYTKYKAATCTESGYAAGVCSRCGADFDDVLEALGHNFKENEIAPSCTAQGAVITACTRCDEVSKARFIPALGHSYKGTVKAATCTDEGYTTYVCENCSNTYIGDNTAALGHEYETEQNAPTCTESGYTYYKCNRCGDSQYGMFTPAVGHKYTIVEVVKPTSVKTGYTKYTCSSCGYSYLGNITQALGPTSVIANCADTVQVGKTIKITTELTPSGIVDRVYFKSSNTKIATVSATGVITGKAVGTVKIKCYVNNGKYKMLTVKVKTPSTQISKLISVAKSRLKITWNQVNYCDGYCIQYSTDKNFKKNRTTKYISGKKNTSVTYKSLKSGKRYYVRVAAYKTVSGKKSLSSWSKVKYIKVK